MPVARFVLDTNVLLQCRDLPELPWSDITDAHHVELYLSATVMMEIEKLKSDGNERRSDRARRTSARLRALADEADRRLILREKSPRLVLLLPPPLAEVDEERILGHALHDYRIVEETRLIAAAVGDACLLTNDIGPRLRAERRGMTVSHVGEDWLLPRESSMLEKRVAKLERAVAERGVPIIHARLFAPDHPDLHFTATTFEVPPDELVEALCTCLTQHEVAEAQREVDRATRSFLLPLTMQSPEDRLVDVQEWQKSVREFLRQLPTHVHLASRLHQFTLSIKNEGGGPAEHVKVTINGRGNAMLGSASAAMRYWNADDQYLADARKGAPHLAAPPLPEPDSMGMANVPTLVDMLAKQDPKDRYAFYRTSEDQGDHAFGPIVFECEDFRHGGDDVEIHFCAIIGGAQPKGGIRVVVTAFNLAEPVVIDVETTANEGQKGDIVDTVRAMAELLASGIEQNKVPSGW